MNPENTTPVDRAKQPVEVGQAIKTCLLPSALIITALIGLIYAVAIFADNLKAISLFFALPVESLNTVLALTYLAITLLVSSACVCVKYQKARNRSLWIVFLVLVGLMYGFLLFLFAHSYWGLESLSTFQTLLVGVSWLPAVLFAFVMIIAILEQSFERNC